MSLHEHHRVKTENNSFNADSRLLTKKWWQAFVLIVGCYAMSESVPKSRFIFMQKIKTEESLLLVSTMWWTCPNLTQNSQPLVTQPTGSLSWPPVTRARDTVSRVTQSRSMLVTNVGNNHNINIQQILLISQGSDRNMVLIIIAINLIIVLDEISKQT